MNDECVIPDYQKPKILYAEFEESTFLQRELWRCACLWEESQTGGLPLSHREREGQWARSLKTVTRDHGVQSQKAPFSNR